MKEGDVLKSNPLSGSQSVKKTRKLTIVILFLFITQSFILWRSSKSTIIDEGYHKVHGICKGLWLGTFFGVTEQFKFLPFYRVSLNNLRCLRLLKNNLPVEFQTVLFAMKKTVFSVWTKKIKNHKCISKTPTEFYVENE